MNNIKTLVSTLFVLFAVACGGPIDGQNVAESDLSFTSRGAACECGQTTMEGITDCHACPGEVRVTSAKKRRSNSSAVRHSANNTLVAPGGPEEGAHCCEGCSTVGSGDGCQDVTTNSCDVGECFLDCACGETTQNGSVTCHNC